MATICVLSLGLVASEMAVATLVAGVADAAPSPKGPTATFQKGDPSGDPAKLPALASAAAPAKDPVPSGDFSFDPNLPRPPGWTPPATQGFVAGQSQEVASQTSSTRKVFDNPDGTVTEQLSISPVRFKDATGAWKPFDDALSAKAGRLVPAGAPAGTSIAATADSTSVAQATTTAGPVGLEQPGAKPVAAKITGGDATFAGALGTGTDLVVKTLPVGFETTVVVAGPSVSSFPQTLNVPAGVTARNGGPGVELVDGAGKVVGSYGSGVATDAAPHPQDAEVLTRLVAQAGTKVQVTVSVDPKWLADPARVFPVAIDPTFTQYSSGAGAMDTYVQSNIVNTPQSTATDLKEGKAYGTTYVRRALLKFDVSSLVGANRQVTSATLGLQTFSAPSCTAKSVVVHSLAAPFDANTVWSNQPGYGGTTITSPAYAMGYTGCPAGLANIDIQTLAQKWIDGSANYGIGLSAVSESDDLGGKAFYSGETIGAPLLTITYNRPPTTQGAPSAPAAGATVSTTQPTLTVTPGVDPDGDALQYAWSVGTSPDPTTGTVLASGWQPAGQTSWKVPAGSLVDGSTYYWTVSTWDGKSWPAAAPAPRAFTVDMRLGADGLSPMDSVGPAQVNLTNGNLVVSTGSPTFSTVGGGIGVNYTYNSQAEPTGGLTGSYYGTAFGSTNHRTNTPDNPSLVRRDPVMNFNWGTNGAPAGIGSGPMYAKWTGFISIPTTGGYKIGGSCSGGLTFTLGTAVADAWTGCPAGVDTWSATVDFNAGDVVPITAEYWRQSGTASVNLKVRGPGLPAPAGINMPATWMSTTAPGLPAGWDVSADLDGAATYASAVITSEAVTFVELDGTKHRYGFDAAKNAYQPPPDEHGTVGRNTDGTVTLLDDDGQTYTFDTDGKLTSVTSALDDTQRAAATMAWTGSPARLSSITDPVSGRKITLAYAGHPACSTGTGYAPAPGGMLCALDYADFAGGTSYLRYDPSGRLARIEDPGSEITDFAYDTAGRMSKVRDPLAADAVAAGVRADDDTTRTVIAYDAANKVTSVTQPAPQASEARPAHSYGYGSSGTNVTAAGLTSTTGKLQHVGYDLLGRPTSVTDLSGGVTTTAWDPQNRPISTTDARTGLTNTTIYDAQGNTTDTWGPAPTSWWTNPATGGAPAAANQAATPHESTVFDEGMTTLASTWWNNNTFTGAPADRATGLAPPSQAITANWGAGTPTGVTGAFSGRLTGWINLTNTNPVNFQLTATGTARLYVANRLVIDGATATGATTATAFNGTYTPGGTGAGWQPVTIEYADTAINASLNFLSRQGTTAYAPVATSALVAGYGLATSATDANGNVTTTSYTDNAAGLGPEDGLATATTTDPTGLALVNRTTYEGAGGYRREVSHQLPTGAPSTVATSYYGATETRNVPCSGGDTGVNQAGMTKRVTAADPSGSGNNGLARETVYDNKGRPAATQVVADGVNTWSCTAYDARSRPVTVTAPDLAQRPGRVSTTSYAVGANPLVTSVTDTVTGQPARTVTSTVDLLGQVRQYVDAWGDTTITSYDQVGRVTQTQSAVGTETMTYDAAGNEGPTVLDGTTLATPHYDSANRLDWVQYANGTKTDPVARDALGREIGSTWRNTATNTVLTSETSTLDLGSRLTDLTTNGNDPRPSAPNYLYDAAGRLTAAWTTTRDSASTIGSQHSAYGFGAASSSCASGTQAGAGKNTNRTSQTIGDGGAAVTTSYCYDAADRLVSTTAPGVGAPSYDSHGNTTTLWGEDRGYDAIDRHIKTVHAGTTVTYTRDGTDRIIAREVGNPATETEHYGFTGGGDTPDLTLDASNAVVERSLSLPGGASVTYRGTDQVWSLSNLHGDTTLVTDATGAVQGPARTYDPFGNTTVQPLIDNSAGAFDYAWLGEHQRPTEHETGLAQTIEMGARQYDPTLGRFLETDPLEGGSANDYDYVSADPVNGIDLDGTCKARHKGVWGWVRSRRCNGSNAIRAAGNYLSCTLPRNVMTPRCRRAAQRQNNPVTRRFYACGFSATFGVLSGGPAVTGVKFVLKWRMRRHGIYGWYYCWTGRRR